MSYATLRSRIPQIAVKLSPEVHAAVREGAELIAEDAKERVAVDTGTLRDAIHTEDAADGVYVIAGDDEAFYGHIVEHGGVRTSARPFLIPAKEARQDDVLQTVEDALEDL